MKLILDLFYQVVCRSVKNKTLTGYSTIVSAMGRESKFNQFGSSDSVTQTLVAQWFDYAVLFIAPAVNSKASTEIVLQVHIIIYQKSPWNFQ